MPLYAANQIISDVNLNANGAQVDNTVFTGTPTSNTQFAKAWDVPANTTQSRSAFRITTVGQSVMGTTALVINFAFGYGPGGSTFFLTDNETQPASSTWYFTMTVWMAVNTGGSGGQAFFMGQIRAGQIPNNSVVNWTFGTFAAAWNTTVDNKLCGFVTAYSASTGTPVCTTSCSVLERLG